MIDLDSILAIADYYDKRKQTMIELGALKDPAYLATLAEGEAIKAFEALRPLVARVRELERQREYLALNAAYGCHAYYRYAPLPSVGDCQDCPIKNKGRCRDVTQNDWIDAAEQQAAKEAVE